MTGSEIMGRHLDSLLRKFDEDALFRRLAIGSATFSEMVAEAFMRDRTGQDYRLAAHGAKSIDVVAPTGGTFRLRRSAPM
jgi:hypothetical protein